MSNQLKYKLTQVECSSVIKENAALIALIKENKRIKEDRPMTKFILQMAASMNNEDPYPVSVSRFNPNQGPFDGESGLDIANLSCDDKAEIIRQVGRAYEFEG